MNSSEYSINIKADFMQKQARSTPTQALAELIWNALDADATEVRVELARDAFEKVDKIRIVDNGTGISYNQTPDVFTNLGGSWKRNQNHTLKLKRKLHGKEGQARFKVFALGSVADWDVVYSDEIQTQHEFQISLLERDMSTVRVSDQPTPTSRSTGVVVTIGEIKRQFQIVETSIILQSLNEIFAIYLRNYRDVTILYDNQRIDPSLAIRNEYTCDLTPVDTRDGGSFDVSLEVIEWESITSKSLFLCNANGFPLSETNSRFSLGDFHFSAYLKSEYIDQLNQSGLLEVGDLNTTLRKSIEEAQLFIGKLYRDSVIKNTQDVVGKWKDLKVYPFQGEPSSILAKVEREVFDIVAVTTQEAHPELVQYTPKQTELHLKLLKTAISKSPTDLQKIFDEVLRLPRKKQKELAMLLDETNLSSIISAAKLVADRLKFLDALKFMLFDKEAKKQLKERRQLHRILEQNTWVFGEEYNLWASDKDLTTVLRIHKSKLDANIVIDEPVTKPDGKRGIVDLMFSKAQRKHRADDIEHLIVELKAPKVVISSKEVNQIEDYAGAVSEDLRFHTISGLRWHFWLVSDEYDQNVKRRIDYGPDPRRRLILKGDKLSVGIMTWAEIIEDNLARLQHLKKALEHKVDDEKALTFLRDRHGDLVENFV